MRKLIYIMGCANCGSTLLTSLLARHSQIATVGELKVTAIPDVENYLCGCGESFLRCQFWKSVKEICENSGISFDPAKFNTHFRSQSWLNDKLIRSNVRNQLMESVRRFGLSCYSSAKNELAGLIRHNLNIVDAVCATEKKDVFLDGSKDPTRLLHFWRSKAFDVRPIYLIRDGRAVVASYKKRDANMSRNISLWKTKTLECERVKKMLPPGSLWSLRYEDFCADVPGSLSDIFAFAGLRDEGTECANPDKISAQHIIGHNSRLDKSRDVQVRKEWQTLLSKGDVCEFNRHGNKLNSNFGYT